MHPIFQSILFNPSCISSDFRNFEIVSYHFWMCIGFSWYDYYCSSMDLVCNWWLHIWTDQSIWVAVSVVYFIIYLFYFLLFSTHRNMFHSWCTFMHIACVLVVFQMNLIICKERAFLHQWFLERCLYTEKQYYMNTIESCIWFGIRAPTTTISSRWHSAKRDSHKKYLAMWRLEKKTIFLCFFLLIFSVFFYYWCTIA